MIKKLELVGPSCLTNAEDDEPIFVLRANDELAPEVVFYWARLYLTKKMSNPDGVTEKQKAKWAEAVTIARMMEKWLEAKPAEGK